MLEQTEPLGPEVPMRQWVTVKLPPGCRVNKRIIETLDMLLEVTHPSEFKRDFTNILMFYIMQNCDNLGDDFKAIMENYIIFFEWLDVVEDEMDLAGFERG